MENKGKHLRNICNSLIEKWLQLKEVGSLSWIPKMIQSQSRLPPLRKLSQPSPRLSRIDQRQLVLKTGNSTSKISLIIQDLRLLPLLRRNPRVQEAVVDKAEEAEVAAVKAEAVEQPVKVDIEEVLQANSDLEKEEVKAAEEEEEIDPRL